MTQEMFEALGKSLNKLGLYDTILVGKPDEQGRYIVKNGNWRIKSLRDNDVDGSTKIWAFSFDGDESELTLLRQSLNKTHGRHNHEKDLIEYAMLKEAGQLDLLAELLAKPKEQIMDYKLPLETNYYDERHENPTLTKDEFNKQFNHYDESPDTVTPMYPPDRWKNEFEKYDAHLPNKEPKSKHGQTYKLGRHRLLCGDAKVDLDLFIKGIEVNLLLTDPPYGISIVSLSKYTHNKKYRKADEGTVGGGKICDVTPYRKVIGDDEPFDPRFLLQYGNTQVIFGGNYFAHLLPQSSAWLVWNKTKPEWKHSDFADCEMMWTNQTHAARLYTQVWRGMIRPGETDKRTHPTQKPVRLLAEIIMDYTEKDTIVLDPFIGSGSTLMACEDTGRTCYAMEIDPIYVDDVIERWEKHTGLQAVLEKS